MRSWSGRAPWVRTKAINYTQHARVGRRGAASLTGGEGVDLVLEVGGEKTVVQSLAALRMQGTMVIVGGVSGTAGGIHAARAGSRRDRACRVCTWAAAACTRTWPASSRRGRIKPVVDKACAFAGQ